MEKLNFTVPFNCTDFIACPSGTFHPDGKANETSGCIKCPSCSSTPSSIHCQSIGQSDCPDGESEFIRGDMDGDGILSQREILRLFYVLTGGHSWGELYSQWENVNVDKCTLPGINCKGDMVTKIDLRGANLCQSRPCNGIPSEIGNLGDSLEILDLSGSFPYAVAIDIPPSIGRLTNLKVLDLSQNRVKSFPKEIGLMSSLQVLNLKQCRYFGFFPPTLWDLKNLQKMNLNDNNFSGTSFPSELGKLTNLRELLLSRTNIKGTIPTEIGALTHMKNLEFYGNGLEGAIPSSFENLTNLRRLDIFSNFLEGPIDFITKLPNFEVVHLRSNKFSGRIPSEIGNLQRLSWLDLADNNLTGEIPSTLSEIPYLKDLFLGNNFLNEPIPLTLCRKPGLNGLLHLSETCDHILCPKGTHSKEGFANPSKGTVCQPCNDNETAIHLGTHLCVKMSQLNILTMFDALIQEREWYNHDIDDEEGIGCNLSTVNCDEEGNILSLEIPLSGISIDEGLFQG